ncbi:histidine kinase [Marinobacter sp. EhC06]|jgi:two-component system CitB family sensor kinase|uniref:ATP-binding protein n=1 Tax=unclassified Marinobacter TaxID=83889 RepID=UPI0007D9E4C6|nr:MULTISPECIES: sensor histidine kinase [unclassified Marinobacter]OAN92380.1 histidine kinase [Marinobacter sp. EhN04]OAN95942.1 histidine kinase [Marinobacter sp. EhC06]
MQYPENQTTTSHDQSVFRKTKLKTRMILTLGLLGALQTMLIGGFAGYYLSDSLYDEIGQRALMVAKTVAATPAVIDGVRSRDVDGLNRLATRLTKTNEALFIVIGDHDAVRLAHPDPDRIGHSMGDDDGDFGRKALVEGNAYVALARGSLGESMRGKAPITVPETGEIVGIVSVGYSLGQVEATIQRYNFVLYGVVGLMLLVTILSAIVIAGRFKQAIFGLEPEEIARLFREREATLQSVREGIIAVNRDGIITTANRAAYETLDLPTDKTLAGRPILEVLPESSLMSVLSSGHPDFDREIWLRGRQMVVNRLPVRQGDEIIGVVASFRLRNELDQVSRQLTRIQQYADTLRSQTHEYSNKLHTIAGLIQIGANEEALSLIGSEVSDHQALIHLLLEAVPDPVIAGCLLGKYNRAREMGLRLDIDPDSQMADLPAALPRDQLVSVLGNLIDNALDATRLETGAGGRVQLSMTDLGQELIFEVQDQGPGIPEAERQRIFEKGVSSKEGEARGYGLHLVQQFLGYWGGSVTVDNIPEGGSRFTLYLPKKPERRFEH